VAKKKLWGDHTSKLGALERRHSNKPLHTSAPGGGTVFFVRTSWRPQCIADSL